MVRSLTGISETASLNERIYSLTHIRDPSLRKGCWAFRVLTRTGAKDGQAASAYQKEAAVEELQFSNQNNRYIGLRAPVTIT